VRFFGRRLPDIPVDRNPAQDDVMLRSAVVETRGGDWGPARDLLATVRDDYDRRARIVQVLAASTAGDGDTSWPDVWAQVEPGNADAQLTRARSLIARDQHLTAVPVNDRAAALAPADPTPWAQRLLLMTALGADRDTFDHAWTELAARDPWHREAHGVKLVHLCRKRAGSHQEMFAFARSAAAAAPAGSPLAVLPLEAANEWALWETHHGAGGGSMRKAVEIIRTQREDPEFQDAVSAAHRDWFEQHQNRHAMWFHDLNQLAQAAHRAGRHDLARPVFAAIGQYFEPGPWSYAGGVRAFHRARRKALT
jgi:hypothetical protein